VNDSAAPTILVIVGITGDLARHTLLPAIERLAAREQLPPHFRIVGVSRQDVSAKDIIAQLPKQTHKNYAFLQKHLEMFRMNLDLPADYDRLRARLDVIQHTFGKSTQRLFYLSVPAQISLPIIRCLGESGMAKQDGTKLLPEKPFGTDLTSAEELITQINQHFDEAQVYRIDHYLAKAMAQNLLVFRRGNSLFKRTWNKDFIERIEITASEKKGIEQRVTFYEQTGALRDVVQSHLLQLAALTLMELPGEQAWEEVPRRRQRALDMLVPPSRETLDERLVRGQYQGYQQEVSNPDSSVETFVSLTLESADPRWQGVPIVLTTGKNLDRKYTEVRIHYRQEDASEANQLVLRIQPKEGIELALWSKQPGYGRELEPVRLDFDYGSADEQLPEAYEQVFLDAIHSNHTLFTSYEEVLSSWRLLQPILDTWSVCDNSDLVMYKPGTSITELLA
jgi:glucose-6-phosphate 1-dehydrogenase